MPKRIKVTVYPYDPSGEERTFPQEVPPTRKLPVFEPEEKHLDQRGVSLADGTHRVGRTLIPRRLA